MVRCYARRERRTSQSPTGAAWTTPLDRRNWFPFNPPLTGPALSDPVLMKKGLAMLLLRQFALATRKNSVPLATGMFAGYGPAAWLQQNRFRGTALCANAKSVELCSINV